MKRLKKPVKLLLKNLPRKPLLTLDDPKDRWSPKVVLGRTEPPLYPLEYVEQIGYTKSRAVIKKSDGFTVKVKEKYLVDNDGSV